MLKIKSASNAVPWFPTWNRGGGEGVMERDAEDFTYVCHVCNALFLLLFFFFFFYSNALLLKLGGGSWNLLFLVPFYMSEMLLNFLKGQWIVYVFMHTCELCVFHAVS